MPYHGYKPPDWWRIAQAARYWHVPPWELEHQSTFWLDVASACSDVENHYNETHKG